MKPQPLDELLDKLKRLDEVLLLELLEISSDQLVDRFQDLIEENIEKCERELDDF